MEVGLVPGHIVLDRDPAPRPEGAEPPNFRSMSVVAKRLDESRCHYIGLDGDPAFPQTRGTAAPNFRPMSDVAKPMDGSTCH